MLEKKKVLVVDDEGSITKMMSMLLQSRGYAVDIASSGQEAIQKSINKPDLILLDLMLPDLQGFEVCRRIRQKDATRHIPIIIISVKYLFEDKIEGLYLGADDYLTKPFDYEELFARMEAVLRRHMFTEEDHHDQDAIILELHHIMDHELITPYYQPILYLKNFKLLGYEALSRPPQDSILSNPEVLFQSSVRYGVYADLEAMCWKKILKRKPVFAEGQKLFLNCNPYLIESHNFFKVKNIFEQAGFLPQDTILEVTERSAVLNFSVFYERLRQYRSHGFGIAIDDVGSGYASLESVIETQPTVLKINTHLSTDLFHHPIKESLIKFIVSFCRENNIISVAEGIEKKEDLDRLIALGVDAGQGYLLSRPLEQPSLASVYQNLKLRLNLPSLPE